MLAHLQDLKALSRVRRRHWKQRLGGGGGSTRARGRLRPGAVDGNSESREETPTLVRGLYRAEGLRAPVHEGRLLECGITPRRAALHLLSHVGQTIENKRVEISMKEGPFLMFLKSLLLSINVAPCLPCPGVDGVHRPHVLGATVTTIPSRIEK